MRVPFRLVDVFAERPLEGNQLCVVPEAVGGLSDDRMQAIAREIGFSETTFVTNASGDRYGMRIFTRGTELAFAGHPTLGTAFVLVSEGRVAPRATQIVEAGEFEVHVDVGGRRARMRQLAATFGEPMADLPSIASAVGLPLDALRADVPPRFVSTGIGHLMVGAVSEDAVLAARPNADALRQLLAGFGDVGVYLFALDGRRARARLFAPGAGVDEDPATGSAAGPLGAYCCEHGLLDPGRLIVSQGANLGRPSTLVVDTEREGDGWRPWVEGGVFVVGSGAFVLDAQE
jgi:trans-2,3-dihydro-3-hydroxyanthranilate isomerase